MYTTGGFLKNSELNIKIGSTIRIRGRNLSFDITDLEQGIFLENETGIIRLSKYLRRGSNIVDTYIQDDVAPGTYSLSVVTKPSSSYYTSSFSEELKITE